MRREDMTKEQLKARIMLRLKRLIKRLEGIVFDKEQWNATRNDCEPFDIGLEKMMIDAAEKELAAWDRDDMETVNIMGRRLTMLARISESI